MNTFWLSRSYRRNARLYNQIHLIKMILEGCQQLSTALHLLGLGVHAPYKPTHQRHPCTVWCAQRRSNFLRLCRLNLALCHEYTCRRKPAKNHACEDKIRCMSQLPRKLWRHAPVPSYAKPPVMGWVGRRFQVPLAMDPEFHREDACTAYRLWVLHKMRTNPHFQKDPQLPRKIRKLEKLCQP